MGEAEAGTGPETVREAEAGTGPETVREAEAGTGPETVREAAVEGDPERMRAAVVGSDRRIGCTTLPRPACGPGQVQIRVEACGLCGSDLHAARRGHWTPGLVPGHEIAGRVEQLGRGAGRGAGDVPLAVGKPVVIEPLETCGRCASCRSGHDPVCPELAIRGVHRPGGFAESIVVSAERVHSIDAAIEAHTATLIEPLAVALHALDRGGLEPGERVLVIGAGTIGLLCSFAARQAGAAEVLVRSRYAHQAERARALGASVAAATGAPEDARSRGPQRAAAGTDFDLVIETVGGSGRTLVEASQAVRARGRIVVLGLFDETPALDPMLALEKELCLLWSNCYQTGGKRGGDFSRAADLMAREQTTLAPLVTHRVGLEQIREAFALAGNKQAGVGKLVVAVSGDPGGAS